MNLEKTSNNLHDLQENYKLLVSTLKEKERTISKLLKSGKLIDGLCWQIYGVIQFTVIFFYFV